MGGVSDAVEKDLARKVQDEEPVYGAESFFHEVAIDFASIDIEQFIRQHYTSNTLLDVLRQVVGEGLRSSSPAAAIMPPQTAEASQQRSETAGRATIILTLGDISGWVTGTAGEGHDSTSLRLPGVQQELLEAVPHSGKPVVLVLFDGWPPRPALGKRACPGHPGCLDLRAERRRGIAGVLFGQVNPCGKLPLSIPRSVGQVPSDLHHRIASGYLNPTAAPIVAPGGHGWVCQRAGLPALSLRDVA